LKGLWTKWACKINLKTKEIFLKKVASIKNKSIFVIESDKAEKIDTAFLHKEVFMVIGFIGAGLFSDWLFYWT
jgi:hypothetical protein